MCVCVEFKKKREREIGIQKKSTDVKIVRLVLYKLEEVNCFVNEK